MNNLKRWFSIALVSGLTILLVGILATRPALAQGPGWMMGGGMMGGLGWMMGNTQAYTGTPPFGPSRMMGGMMNGMMNGMIGGMMVNSNSPFFTAQPLTLAEATETLNTYLANLNDSNLAVAEVMIFDNHAYAEIVEKDTGIGVMEVLVDPNTRAVYPEMGPNMMWNLKYGMMSGFGRYGMMGMMRGNFSPTDLAAEMPITAEKAIEAAQTYLDSYFKEANLTVAQKPIPSTVTTPSTSTRMVKPPGCSA